MSEALWWLAWVWLIAGVAAWGTPWALLCAGISVTLRVLYQCAAPPSGGQEET